jgi:EAL domain-containing protein (putative c-di-GMP-specific phosphodiesterase class I)
VAVDDLRTYGPGDAGLLDIVDRRAVRAVYQPVVAIDGRGIVGFEALARGPVGTRWAHPAALFERAAALGRLPELDWVCRAAAVYGAVAADLDPRLALFVNVEPGSNGIPCPDDLAEVIRIADRWPIIAEITERAVAQDLAGMLATVDGLRSRQRHVALDDVGGDPASLAMMPLLRPDVIKLDRTIIDNPDTAHAQAVIAAVQAEAIRGGAVILAEGVETPRHLATARALGATLAQGFLLGRPGPLPAKVDPHPTLFPRRTIRVPSADTPFGTVAASVTPSRINATGMDLLSRAMEERAATAAEATILLAGFPHGHRPNPDSVGRFRDFGAEATLAAVFVDGRPARSAEQVRGYVVKPDDAIANEWTVIVISGTGIEGLFGRISANGTDYDVVGSNDRDVILAAARCLIERMQAV